MKLALFGAFSLLALAGCNMGQPRIYRVAVDETPIRTIAVPSCFKGNALPAGRGNLTLQNYRTEYEWVIWDGVNGIQYLDIGTAIFELGDSPDIRVNQLIEGSEKTFSALRNESEPILDQYTYARQTQISVKFDDYNNSPTGTISLNAQFACVPGRAACPNDTNQLPPDAASCNSTLNFVSRKIEAQHFTAYNNNPQ